MIILENNKYVVSLPEHGLWQDINPGNRGLPFATKKEAEQWEADWIAKQEASLQAMQAEAELQAAEKAAQTPEPETIDVDKLSDAEFRRLVLARLGYAVKEA